MARRKKIVEVVKETTEAEAPQVEDKPRAVRKLIQNPMRLSMSTVLENDDVYTLTVAERANEEFMKHIQKLIDLKNIERV